jgi:hemolysin activation/secretion protein
MFNSRLKQAVAATWLCIVYMPSAWPVGGAESMDRPSARPLPIPEYSPGKPPEGLAQPPETEPLAPREEPNENYRQLPITHITISGNTVIPDQQLRHLVEPYEGRRVSLSELEALRQKLTRLYLDLGYMNSGAIIPEDGYANGKLHFEIVEGRLDEVRIEGQGRLREGYIRNRLRKDPTEPLNLRELQDRFQLLLSDPLIEKMNGQLLPGATLGHSLLNVQVTRARPYGLSFFGDNYRPPSIGAEAFGVNGWVRNLTGLGDLFDFTFMTSEGSDRYNGGLSIPVTDQGSLVFFHFDEGESQVMEPPTDRLHIQSLVHNREGGFSHPFINTLNQRFAAGVSLATRENETSLLDRPFSFVPGEPTGHNQATVWRMFQDYSQRWDRNAVSFRSTFSVGMNALGATPETNPRLPSSEFFAWLGQAQYAHLVTDKGGQLVLRGMTQFSDSPLLPLERIAVGGIGTVRGYRENHLVRDQGYALSLEFRYPMIGGNNPAARHRLVLVPFMDYGEAWNLNQRAETLHSVGIGFNWEFKPVYAELYYGYKLIKPRPDSHSDLQDDGIHFLIRLDAL